MSPKMIFCCPFFRISNQAVYLHEIWHVGTSTNIRKKQKMAVSFLQTPSTLNMHDVPSPHRTQNTEHIQTGRACEHFSHMQHPHIYGFGWRLEQPLLISYGHSNSSPHLPSTIVSPLLISIECPTYNSTTFAAATNSCSCQKGLNPA